MLFSSLDEFEIIHKVLGKGVYGFVKMGRHIKTDVMYALKIISLAKLKPYEKIFVESEITIHKTLCNSNIVT